MKIEKKNIVGHYCAPVTSEMVWEEPKSWDEKQAEAERRSTIKRRIQDGVMAGTLTVAAISTCGVGAFAFTRRATTPVQFLIAFTTMPATLIGSFHAADVTRDWLYNKYGVSWRD